MWQAALERSDRIPHSSLQALSILCRWRPCPEIEREYLTFVPSRSYRPPVIPCLFLGMPPAFAPLDTVHQEGPWTGFTALYSRQ